MAFQTTHSNGTVRVECSTWQPLEPTTISLYGPTGWLTNMSESDAIELAEMLLIAAGQDDAAMMAMREVAKR